MDKTFIVTVDGEPVTIPRKGVTPRKILELASLNPAERYLLEKIGTKTRSFQSSLDEEITVHQNQVFVTGRLGSVPVS